jgi:membrane protein
MSTAIVHPVPPPSSSRRSATSESRARRPRNAATLGERLRSIGALLKEAVSEWQEDEATRLAAALALYTLLSLAPLLVIAVSVAGLVFGDEAARGQISQQISALVGAQAGQAIEGMIANARSPEGGILGSVVGVVVLLFGASGVFGELQSALNRIWEVKPKPGRGLRGFLRDRFLSFSMVMGVAFLLLVSLVVSTAIVALTSYFEHLVPLPALWHVLNILVGLVLTGLLFALTFKTVPDAKTAWRDVLVGGAVTAVLFAIGRAGLSWYVGRASTTSAFGAAGSLVALIVWVYYSAQILFMGAEFTQVYAARRGNGIEPTPNAVPAEPDAKTAR